MIFRALIIFLMLPQLTLAADYYVSMSGRDSNSGESPGAPWQSFSKVNDLILRPGDRVLLRGGDTFSGILYFDSFDRGAASSPIRIKSYGTGRARILAGDGHGILAYNTAGYVISDLDIVGSGRDTNNGSGIFFYADLPGDVKLDRVVITRVDVSGFHHAGIEVGAWNGATGFSNVSISQVQAYDNAKNGITVWGYDAPLSTIYAHRNVFVTASSAYRNHGVSGLEDPSGNGIVISNVDGGGIASCTAYDNGSQNTSNSGPVGIWAWRANRVKIEYNESFDNRTTTGASDGGGFDLDGGVTNSILQYNYSHGNDGHGYLLAQYAGAAPFRKNTIRYNISENDGRRNSSAGIYVWSHSELEITDSHIYNNTIYVSPSSAGNVCALRVVSPTSGLRIRNNVIFTTGGVPLLCVADGQVGMKVQGNAYWSDGSEFKIRWGADLYSSLAAFRASGQEMLKGTATGMSVNPQLDDPGFGGTVGNPDDLKALSAYRPTMASPLVNTGLDLKALFGIAVGDSDFSGTLLPQDGAFDVGAHEL